MPPGARAFASADVSALRPGDSARNRAWRHPECGREALVRGWLVSRKGLERAEETVSGKLREENSVRRGHPAAGPLQRLPAK